jgi:ERCC4-type nuclease
MVIPENQDGRIDVVSLTSDLFDDEADAASTRRGGARQRSSGDDQRPRVLVDVREFRSSLPSFIDLQVQLTMIPDLILT